MSRIPLDATKVNPVTGLARDNVSTIGTALAVESDN